MLKPNATTPRVLLAASCYFGVVFGLGFACGLVRVPILEPRFGELGALMFEAPVMLAGIVLAAPKVCRRFGVPPTPPARLAVGLAALVLLLGFEVMVGVWARGMTMGQIMGRFGTTPGILSLLLYLVFAAMPWLRRRA